MANKDYYETLGISRTATKDEIKSAYRKLAMKYHPDRNKEEGAEKKFMEIQEAYDILYDDNKRKTYDQFGSAAFEQGGQGGNPFQGFGGGGFGGFDGFGDIFSQMFGGDQRNSNPHGPQRGNDSLMRVKISFMDSINGKKITIPVTYEKVCETCNGTGAKSKDDIKPCPHCGGKGYINSTRQTLFGTMQTQEECPYCHGSGKTIVNKCSSCNGSGYKKVKEDLSVNIPAGISSGQQIRVQGKGSRGINGGSNGDLYIEIIVAPHNNFTRDGNDIHIEIPIDFVDACLGIDIEVPTVYGSIELKIPAGSQPNQIFKIKDRGVKDMRTQRPGNQYVHLKIATPTVLSKAQKEALINYKKAEKKDESIFQKFIKGFKK